MDKRLNAIVRVAEQFLTCKGIEDAQISSRELLRSVLAFDKCAELFLFRGSVTRAEVKKYFKMVRARGKKYPLQYITGEVGFRDHVFRVEAGVLIPRPETELLVDVVLAFLRTMESPVVLDIGTGSGCIAISVASECPEAQVVALDVSPKALSVARENAERLNVIDAIEFIESDCFQGIVSGRLFDCIVSNPPYIRQDDMANLQQEVHYEPERALVGGESGLDVYTTIIDQAPFFLKSGGMIFFEIGYDQAQDVCALLRDRGFLDCTVSHDLTGKERIVSARKE